MNTILATILMAAAPFLTDEPDVNTLLSGGIDIDKLGIKVPPYDEWVPYLGHPLSGDEVVLNDRKYVLLTLEDFAVHTNKMNILCDIARHQWNAQHSTEDGRVKWHGRRVHTTFATNDVGRMERITEYEDGYRHVETAGSARKPEAAVKRKTAIDNRAVLNILRTAKRRQLDGKEAK